MLGFFRKFMVIGRRRHSVNEKTLQDGAIFLNLRYIPFVYQELPHNPELGRECKRVIDHHQRMTLR